MRVGLRQRGQFLASAALDDFAAVHHHPHLGQVSFPLPVVAACEAGGPAAAEVARLVVGAADSVAVDSQVASAEVAVADWRASS